MTKRAASAPPDPNRRGLNRGALPLVSEAKTTVQENTMRAVLLWLLGIPIPVIILLYVFHVI